MSSLVYDPQGQIYPIKKIDHLP